MSDDHFQEIGIDDGDDGIGKRVEGYKANKKEKHRLSLALWAGFDSDEFSATNLDAPSPRFLKVKTVFVPNLGNIIATPEIVKLVGAEARERVGTLVIQWPTERDGKINKDEFKKGKWMVKPWVFSATKYHEVVSAQVNGGFSLGKSDLMVWIPDTSKKEEKWQEFSTQVLNENYFRMLLQNENAKTHVTKLLTDIREAMPELKRILGRVETIEKIREKLGQGGTTTVSEVATGASAADVAALLDAMNLD